MEFVGLCAADYFNHKYLCVQHMEHENCHSSSMYDLFLTVVGLFLFC